MRALRLIAPLLTLALLGGLHAQIRTYAAVDDTTAFHAAVRAGMEAIPTRLGPWEGVDVTMPQAAQVLLRPNVLFARRYTNTEDGVRANLLVIHCKDARDMQGHYPPNCYPGNGWVSLGQPTMERMSLWGREVELAQYRFSRRELEGEISTSVYMFFILPTGEFVTSMNAVRRASGDYRLRPYGAAQFQVLFDARTPEPARRRAVTELLEPLQSVVRTLTREEFGAEVGTP